MNATDYTVAGAEPAEFPRFAHWQLVRWCAVAVYFAALVIWSTVYGIPVQRELVVVWICGALGCASIGRPPRQIVQVVIDWLPLLLVLALYDVTRGAADSLGIGVHSQLMIDFDQFVFFGDTPTQWLQAHVADPDVVNWIDVAFGIIYTSYFIVPFAVAGVLWLRDRPDFLRYIRRLVTLALAGVTTYVLFPAAPPWMVGADGTLAGIDRTTSDGFTMLGVETAGLIDKGQSGANLVAAVPSLHTAITALVAMFFWSRVGRRWRPLLLAYPLAMSFTLMATGEHWLFDIVLGWMYAGAVMAGWNWWEGRRAARALAAV